MNRTSIINTLAKDIGATTYLEIGLYRSELNFDKIQVQDKVSVDPDPNAKAKFVMTSDEYFENLCDKEFDIVFIDGLHTGTQVLRDIRNSMRFLSQNGVIVCHDMMGDSPRTASEEQLGNPWTGTCWRAIAALRKEPEFCDNWKVCTVDCDWGCAVIRRGSMSILEIPHSELITMSFKESLPYRKSILNVISVAEFMDNR